MKQFGIPRGILVAFLFVVACVAAGCGLDTSRIMSPEGCTNKEKVDAELHVDPGDERWIWAIDRQSGAVISLRIPGGYGVSPEPPAIIDPSGRIVGRTGDLVISGCRDVIQNALMIDQSDIRTSGGSSS